MSKENFRELLREGDHIFIRCGVYTHHGIYIGKGQVVHLSGEKGRVAQSSLKEFCGGKQPIVREYSQADPSSTVVSRAVGSIGQEGYHLLGWNCEHFATWCKTGQAESHQADAWVRRGASAGTKLAASALAKAAAGKAAAKQMTKSVSKLGLRAIRAVATPWLLAADAAQLGAELVCASAGASTEKAETCGKLVGLGGSAAIGVAVAGPIGAAVGVGIWFLSELFGSVCSCLFCSPEPKRLEETA